MKLEFEPDPSSMTFRERLVTMKFGFAGDYQKCCACAEKCRERWSSNTVSAVVIKFIALRRTCAINSAAKHTVQLCKYSAAYQAPNKRLPKYTTPFFSCLRAGQNSGRGTIFDFCGQKINSKKSILKKNPLLKNAVLKNHFFLKKNTFWKNPF